MEERQVTIGEETFKLEEPFMVLATQNPLEQEGTFSLPEAQLDRFLLKTVIGYPKAYEEKKLLTEYISRESQKIAKVFGKREISQFQKEIASVELSESIIEYICRLVFATRDSEKYPDIIYGASPRASLALMRTAKILAAM
jgi:MoxR-like ATPase